MPVQMPGVELAGVRRQRVGVLEDHVHCAVGSQRVNSVAVTRVLVLGRHRDVVLAGEILRRSSLFEGLREAVSDRTQVGSFRQDQGDIVESPSDVAVDVVLGVEQQNSALGGCGRRGRAGKGLDLVGEELAVGVVVPEGRNRWR